MLPGIVQSASSGGSLGYDTDEVVTAAVAGLFVQQGYAFCLRYLSIGTPQDQGDLSTAEAQDILNAGLALMPVQHVLEAGWAPTLARGQSYGANAAANAQEVGFPAGVCVWCDLEGVAQGTPAQDVVDYCTAWYQAVAAAGYVAGLYVGSGCILNGEQLYALPFANYWQSASETPNLSGRGYQMQQRFVPQRVNGIGIDANQTHVDSEGGRAMWLVVGD
jgi:hypothetical protein